MLTTRLIPVLLLRNGRMVKTKQFRDARDVGDPVSAARIYNAQDVDELMFLDIDASAENRKTMIGIIEKVSEECFMPLAAGGGIQTIDDVKELMRAGADMVVINTHAIEDPFFISRVADTFGCQAVVVSIDIKHDLVYTRGGKHNTGKNPLNWAIEATRFGAGELLVTSIDHEGMMGGYDIEQTKEIADAVNIPVVANGGAGSLDDLCRAVTDGHASAVAASSIFHFTDQSPIKARSHMLNKGLNMRRI